jgi:hypothetical protein
VTFVDHHDPVSEAIARGDATARLLIGFRDRLFEPLAGIMLIAGEDGLRACLAGVAEAVIVAEHRRARGLPPLEGEILPFPPTVSEGRG